jgi:hypothetical protein
MRNFTTVIRLSESLSQRDFSCLEERIGLCDSTTGIVMEEGQATIDLSAHSEDEANDLAMQIVTAVQEIDASAEIELVTLNDGDEDDGDEDEDYDY